MALNMAFRIRLDSLSSEDPPELLQKVVPLIALTFIDIISRMLSVAPFTVHRIAFLPGKISCIVYYNVAEFWKTTYNVTFVETLSIGTTATFTLIQTSYLLIYIGLAWLPIDLDAVAYEEAHVIPFNYPRVIVNVEIQLCSLQIPVVISRVRFRLKAFSFLRNGFAENLQHVTVYNVSHLLLVLKPRASSCDHCHP
ncbi:hypothetical protein Tco_0407406 [Tanacetum coccineum]